MCTYMSVHGSDGQTYFDGDTETVNLLHPIKSYIINCNKNKYKLLLDKR